MTVFDETKTTNPNGLGFGVSSQVAAVEGAIISAETEIRRGVDGLIGRMKALSDGSFLMSVIQEELDGTEFNAGNLFSGATIAANDESILSLAASEEPDPDYFGEDYAETGK